MIQPVFLSFHASYKKLIPANTWQRQPIQKNPDIHFFFQKTRFQSYRKHNKKPAPPTRSSIFTSLLCLKCIYGYCTQVTINALVTPYTYFLIFDFSFFHFPISVFLFVFSYFSFPFLLSYFFFYFPICIFLFLFFHIYFPISVFLFLFSYFPSPISIHLLH